MATEEIKRLHYYERQYLGVEDFDAEQTYLRDLSRRHNLGQHTWGIVVGLELLENDKEGGDPGVDVFIKPGMAIDGFGREILLLEPYQLPEELFASYVFSNASPAGLWLPVWLDYCEEKTNPPRAGYEQCAVEDQASRIRETYRVVVGKLSDALQRDKISVAGKLVVAEDEIPDGSVPYQTLANTDNARWLIPLGYVRWLPKPGPKQPGDYFVKSADDEKKKTREGRIYAGTVASVVFAPAGALRIADRFSDPLPSDPNDARYSGVAAAIEGSLQVDRLLTAKQDIEIDGGKLLFMNADGKDLGVPLWIQRLASNGGTNTDLRIHLGDQADAATTRLTIGPKSGSDEKVVLAIKADDKVDIPTGILDFGRQTRQMMNLWTTVTGEHQYGIGVQAYTLYERTHGEFCWFRDGTHSDTQSDPGGGGKLQLRLDDQGRLHFGSDTKQMLNLWEDQGILYYGIGVQAGTEYFRSASDFCWFRGGVHSDTRGDAGLGGTLAMKLDDSGNLIVDGSVGANGRLRLSVDGNDASIITRPANKNQGANLHNIYLRTNAEYGGNNIIIDMDNLIVGGDLKVSGKQNLIKVVTFTRAVQNAGEDTPATWSVDYTDKAFAEVYTVFAVLQGFSIWSNDTNFDHSDHSPSRNAIPQHVYVLVDDDWSNTEAHGKAYCSESLASNETDNTILFTVVVLGRSVT